MTKAKRKRPDPPLVIPPPRKAIDKAKEAALLDQLMARVERREIGINLARRIFRETTWD